MKNRYLDVIFTNHAISRLHNRGLTQSDAYEVFKHPDDSRPGKSLNSKIFYKNYGSQKVEVVAKKNDQGEWVILSVWSRLPGQQQPASQQLVPEGMFLERWIMRGLQNLGRLFENN